MKNLKLSILLVSILSFTSCDRTVEFIPEQSDIVETPEGIIEDVISVQNFTVDPEIGDTLISEEGATLILPPFLCEYGNSGGPCIGEIEVTFVEAYNKKDMLLSGKPTMADEQMLESGGEFYINITQGGEQVYIIEGQQYEIKVPVANTRSDSTRMKVYLGLEGTAGNFTWELNENLNAPIDNGNYNIVYDELDTWINLDYPTDLDPLTTISTELDPEELITDSTRVFVAFKNVNSVVEMSREDNLFIAKNIPAGQEIYLVAITKGDTENIYLGLNSVISEPDLAWKLNLNQVSLEELNTQLDAIK
ncbi:hypothetical protein QQ008_20715 [Fulvivirgaceae bacterium BMA10]|uniref:DUF1735 domain-containing protein n=1 Tax=Splendidivirga corallicola TaxID=3051826 RepID=A0ABT8KSU1_9BACT|nr:hypothetical protein [Fulvivirgaceae bacterium BMA10]